MYGGLVFRFLPFVAIGALGILVGWQTNGWRLTAQINHIEARHAAQYAAAQEAAREKEQRMQAAADQLREDKDAQIRTITNRLNSVVAQLRSRPERPSVSSITPDARIGLVATGCSGAELYREDGEFLIREAARAEVIKEGYKQCTKQYESVRKYLRTN
jgi:hypothetical protein